ncbi:MAG: hypothetical protein B6229_01865 [Spirochaetaceae bacterium 4572_7]|nr:MAG: hypothetical protein B6229_01865 [Spirochaetaceae bacterium 4572_7]
MKNRIIAFSVALIVTSLLLTSCLTTNNTTELEESIYPAFTPEGGVYKRSQQVRINAETGDRIFYTIDGSKPTKKSKRYRKAITLDSSTLLRALTIKPDKSEKRSMTMFDFDLSKDAETHLESPIWTDQIIYFTMLDRFYNGDTSNDDMGYDEKSVDQETWFSGGDFKGLESKLDYIKALGATAIWITPPVKNQWSEGNFGGSHGYWASNFMDTDPHFGNIEAYKKLVDTAHKKGLYVIQDIVVNHVGDYFNVKNKPLELDGDYKKWKLRDRSKPTNSPEQLPWKFNDPSNFTLDELTNNSFYNWTPGITDYNDLDQIFTYQLSNLDDLNTKNPVVQNLLRGYFRYWIDKVDIDGYRVDTVKYVEPEFFEGFVNSTDNGNKGIREHASDLGKKDFILFGESWDSNEKFNAGYTQGENGEKRLDSLIYFTLNFKLRDVFASGSPTSELTKVLNNRSTAGYQDPKKLVTFVDNHDMTRLINLTTPNLVKEAYAFIMTIPGIPQLYYGSEQGFTETRRAMFKDGYKEPGVANSSDLFTQDGEWFSYFKSLNTLRKENPIFRDGELKVIKDNKYGNGIFAYTLKSNDTEALVIFNTSSADQIAIDIDSGFNKGDKFKLQKPSLGDVDKDFTIGENGRVSLALPGEAFGIYILESKNNPISEPNNKISITSTFPDTILKNSISISGSLKESAKIRVFVDGNYNGYKSFDAKSDWNYTLDLTSVANGEHEVIALIDNGDVKDFQYSNHVLITLKKPFIKRISQSDPEGDDSGPENFNYIMPTNDTYIHQQDILNTDLYTSGSDIRIDLKMKAITDIWSPNKNAFDHVNFQVFLKKENSNSTVSAMPGYNANVVDEMGSWDYFAYLSGWSAAMFDKDGNAITPTPTSVVDKENATVSITIPAESIGKPGSLNGWKIYITTWDEDMGNLRAIVPKSAEWKFGGGKAENTPLIMDDTAVLTIN